MGAAGPAGAREMTTSVPTRDSAPARRVTWPAVSAFATVLFALLCVFAWRGHREAHDYWRDRLLTVAAHQESAIGVWLAERASDGAMIASFPTVRRAVDPAIARQPAGRVDGGGHLRGIFRDLCDNGGYEGIWLLDGEGRALLRVGVDPLAVDRIAPLVTRAIATASTTTPAAVATADRRRLLAVATPIFHDDRTGKALGAVVLFTDPARGLWPFIDQDAGAPRSGESVLIERAVGGPVVLFPRRYPPRGGSARGGIDEVARSALGGAGAVVEVAAAGAPPVLATARSIPGVDWSVLVKVDRDEAYAAWRAELWQLAAMAGLVVLAAVGVVQAFSRREQAYALAAELARERALQQAHERAEQEIRQLNAELERRVQDRTAALEAANRELESFNYSVSHDLRAPLRHIDGFLRIVLEDHGGELPADVVAPLTRVVAASQRMDALIGALLKLSRLGRQELRRQPVDLAELARAALAELRTSAGERRIELTIQPLPTTSGDPVLLRELFDNLLANAVKFTRPRPTAHIEIGSQAGEATPVFYVRDDGVGFDPAYAHRLFGVFRRLHGDDEFEGTGLGLSIVKRIVERHGGRVWAEGELGRGATIFFTFGPPERLPAQARGDG